MKKRVFFVITRMTALVLTVFAVFLVQQVFDLFRVKKILVICPRPIPLGYSVFNDVHIGMISKDAIGTSFLNSNIFLKTITVKQKVPDTVILTCSLRTPIAKFKKGDGYTYVDEEGVVFDQEEIIAPLPQIISVAVQSVQLAQKDWRLLKAIRYITQLQDVALTVSTLYLEEDASRFRIITESGIEILIPQKEDPSHIVASLQTIMTRFRIEGKFVSKIDFQFEKPIVALKGGE